MNIHAGVKYLASLRDRYFDAADIDERHRWRFAVFLTSADLTVIASELTPARTY